MHRTEMYLREDQLDALRNQAFILTKRGVKRIAISQIVREAIDLWLEKHRSKEMDVVLSSQVLLSGVASAKRELRQGKLLSRKQAFKKKPGGNRA